MIQNGVKLFPTYGGTEFGAPSIFEPREDPNDWAYVEFNDRVKIRWEDQRDGTYECQMLVRFSHSVLRRTWQLTYTDHWRAPPSYWEFTRRKRVCHVRFVGETPYKRKFMENVSSNQRYLGSPLTSQTVLVVLTMLLYTPQARKRFLVQWKKRSWAVLCKFKSFSFLIIIL